MYELKSLSLKAVDAALEKARCYRFLNEPMEAESICLDVLDADPDNQEALILLLLARTDQFQNDLNIKFTQALDVLPRLKDAYNKAYYEGLICERRAKTHLNRGQPGAGSLAYEWLQKAMSCYKQALTGSITGNEDAVLRWNTCVRMLSENPDLRPAADSSDEQMLE